MKARALAPAVLALSVIVVTLSTTAKASDPNPTGTNEAVTGVSVPTSDTTSPQDTSSTQSAPKAQPAPNTQATSGSAHPVGIGFVFGTLGLGGQAAVGLNQKFDIRGELNFLRFSRSTTRDGIHYAGSIHMGNVGILLDWFPWANGFHITPGLLVYNGNEITGGANVPGGLPFHVGNAIYVSSTATPVTGTATIGVNKVAPEVLFGWGSMVPRSHHWSVVFDAGVLFWGSPKVTMNLTGDVCDIGQVNCRSISSDPTVQANIQKQVAKYNSDASPYKVYPVIQLGVGYRF